MTDQEKKIKSEFIAFLATRLFIGEDSAKYASSLNTNVKLFCRKHMGMEICSLYTLIEVSVVQDIRERIVNHSPYVYSRKKHDDKVDGLDLYIEFLKNGHIRSGKPDDSPGTCDTAIRKATSEQEGRHVKREQEIYVRSASAREKCKRHYECTCQACGLRMEEIYGEIGRGFIEVHHLKPIHLYDDLHEIDPIKDLITLCPNCHAMIHKLQDPGDISTLKELIVSSHSSLA